MVGAPGCLVPVNFWGALQWGRGGRESGLSSALCPYSSRERLGGGRGEGVCVLICDTQPTSLKANLPSPLIFSSRRSRFSNGHFLPPLFSVSLFLSFLSFCFLPGCLEETAGMERVEWCWWWDWGVRWSGAPGGAVGQVRAALHVSINREGVYI